MNYTLNYGGESFELPPYNFSIADKLEKQEVINAGNGRFRDKCNSMYILITELLGKDTVEKLIGKFADCDPNEINIIYLLITRTYSKPLAEYTQSESFESLENPQIDKLIELVNAFDKASKLKVIK